MPQPSSKKISFFAPAKINLYLHITAKRNDGYHLIESLVVFADCGDKVSVAPSDKLKLTIEGPFSEDLTSNQDNLVIKAAVLLAKFAGIKPKANIVLTKELPVASGIGGGSADAAATLHALTELWGISISSKNLHILAKQLGSDVPVCLTAGTSIITGIGENIMPVTKLPKLWAILVNPRIPVSTAEVFANYHNEFSIPQPFTANSQSAQELASSLSKYRNDLTSAALRVAPKIKDVLSAVEATQNQLLTRLSGSGATCFALFKTKSAAISATKSLRAQYPVWWVKTISVYSKI
ncbi:4-(cytidine 5'-diphospho)-2-C-methyl-D-erythritol kinase [Gammaproteobacteria bacterium]|nr:4-(cytidine 5'-diphospho)-2-C-methyl-D-erythritol kinase [Gammaproteobacteria bacterium]